LYGATVGGGAEWVTAYPVQRPDGAWSVLLVNRDLKNAHTVQVAFQGDAGTAYFSGTVTQVSFGVAQYNWVPDGAKSRPNPDSPAVTTQQAGGSGVVYMLPAASVNVLRGSVQ
jgi:hypothetical protein